MSTQNPVDTNHPQQIREAVAAEVRAALGRDGRRANKLATDTGISRTALSRKLRGLVPFYVEEILAISEALDVDPAKFIAVAITEAEAA